MDITRTVLSLRDRVSAYKQAGETIALVPTMGALHNGHVSLIDTAKKHAPRVIVSIFVNPTQFAAHEDLNTYPRQEEADLAILNDNSVDIAYLPSVDEMYPVGFDTHINVGSLGNILCGISRPHFFNGVALVVHKLLLQSQADLAVFGEKDYQQLAVIKQLVRDLDIPTTIIGSPLIRDQYGLALSSRNQYLTDSERQVAPILYCTLKHIVDSIDQYSSIDEAINDGKQQLLAAGFDTIDYLEVRQDTDLSLASLPLNKPARIFAAAWLGKTRLIDNITIA